MKLESPMPHRWTFPRSSRWLVTLLALMASASCVDWDRSTSTEVKDIRLFVASVQASNGTEAVLHEGNIPSGGDGTIVSAVLPEVVLKGGSSEVTFTSVTPFTRIVVGVNGVDGYWDLDVGAPTTSATVLIIYAQEVGGPTFSLLYAAGNPDAIGVVSSANTAFLGNATGEVQVNITWNSSADVDLYVVDPYGDEIYYITRTSASGGELDIDSNAGCARDGPRAENIVWPFGVVPPHGEYTVRVNYWSECGEAATDFVVTVRTKGHPPSIYRGRFTGLGVGGQSGAGKRVAGFTF